MQVHVFTLFYDHFQLFAIVNSAAWRSLHMMYPHVFGMEFWHPFEIPPFS